MKRGDKDYRTGKWRAGEGIRIKHNGLIASAFLL